jgi:ABC-type multidrug transport system ATPase subunit
MDVDLNSYSDLFGNSIESGVLYSRQSIHIENISLSTNEISLVDQLSLILHPGDVLGIEGPSGSGKTMLLETIAGLRYPSTGRIVMPSIYVKNMAYLKQDAHIMDESVVDNIEYLRKNIRSKIVIDLISQLQIPNRDRLIGNVGPEVFSGGEKQRLALARTLAANPQLIFLDEPTSAQDENRRDLIIKLIGGNTNRIVIIISHSKEILAKCNKRISLG